MPPIFTGKGRANILCPPKFFPKIFPAYKACSAPLRSVIPIARPTAIAPDARPDTNPKEQTRWQAAESEAEIMEITLDNGRPGMLCCYQEDYHRRLDRPEGTWKRVAVH